MSLFDNTENMPFKRAFPKGSHIEIKQLLRVTGEYALV